MLIHSPDVYSGQCWPDRGWKSETLSSSATLVSRTKTLAPSSAHFPRPFAGIWIRSCKGRTQSSSYLGCCITGSNLPTLSPQWPLSYDATQNTLHWVIYRVEIYFLDSKLGSSRLNTTRFRIEDGLCFQDASCCHILTLCPHVEEGRRRACAGNLGLYAQWHLIHSLSLLIRIPSPLTFISNNTILILSENHSGRFHFLPFLSSHRILYTYLSNHNSTQHR